MNYCHVIERLIRELAPREEPFRHVTYNVDIPMGRDAIDVRGVLWLDEYYSNYRCAVVSIDDVTIRRAKSDKAILVEAVKAAISRVLSLLLSPPLPTFRILRNRQRLTSRRTE